MHLIHVSHVMLLPAPDDDLAEHLRLIEWQKQHAGVAVIRSKDRISDFWTLGFVESDMGSRLTTVVTCGQVPKPVVAAFLGLGFRNRRLWISVLPAIAADGEQRLDRDWGHCRFHLDITRLRDGRI